MGKGADSESKQKSDLAFMLVNWRRLMIFRKVELEAAH